MNFYGRGWKRMTDRDTPRPLTREEAAARAEFTDALADPNSELSRISRKRWAQQNPPPELIAFRVSPALREALEGAAAEAERTLSAEIRYRLERSLHVPRMIEETLRLVLSAVKAGVSAEQIARLIEIHMESLKR
jgi:hypothetical protein